MLCTSAVQLLQTAAVASLHLHGQAGRCIVTASNSVRRKKGMRVLTGVLGCLALYEEPFSLDCTVQTAAVTSLYMVRVTARCASRNSAVG